LVMVIKYVLRKIFFIMMVMKYLLFYSVMVINVGLVIRMSVVS
jgi:hypothetical protein